MAKQITTAKLDWIERKHPWGGDNEEPFKDLLETECEGKTPTECEQIKREIEESFTYLLICERGSITPMEIGLIYQAEKKDGVVGFISKLLEEHPGFLENPVSDFILD